MHVGGGDGRFQSTPPRRGRRAADSTQSERYSSFNPRPHAGGDTATDTARRARMKFQSTPPRRGRHSWTNSLQVPSCFNPRPHAGGDTDGESLAEHFRFQSTPPRRGRPVKVFRNFLSAKFQSTPPRRGRLLLVVAMISKFCFNPRPHAGGDDEETKVMYQDWCGFNPRPHAGGDQSADIRRGVERVSIHAPTQGATIKPLPFDFERKFQSTPPRRGRRLGNARTYLPCCFNPRPHAGGDCKV